MCITDSFDYSHSFVNGPNGEIYTISWENEYIQGLLNADTINILLILYQ